MRQSTHTRVIFDSQSEAGISDVWRVEDYEYIVLYMGTSGTADLRVGVKGSIEESSPTWGNAQSEDNRWEWLKLEDMNDDTNSVSGDTGFAPSAADDHRMFLVDVRFIREIVVEVDNYTAGSVTVTGRAVGEWV